MVRRFAELFPRMGLVRGEGGDYVLSVLSTLMGCLATVGIVFLVCVHVRDLLNDSSIDTNMDINCADDSKARTRQTRRRSRSRKRTLRGNSRENKRGRTEEGDGGVRGSNKW